MHTSSFEKIDNYLDATLTNLPFPNLSIVITNQDDILYSRQSGVGITNDSTFILGSTSKSFTALALLNLLEEKGVALDTPIQQYLTCIDPQYKITLLDLLNHTSGISSGEKISNLSYSGTYGKFEYSNANYNLIGQAIVSISGIEFDEYVSQNIFNLLEMSNSFALSESNINRTVTGHKSYFGFLVPSTTEIPNKETWIQAPSGYLCSSSDDMAIYLRYLLSYSSNRLSLLELVDLEGIHISENPVTEDIFENNGVYGFGWIHKRVNGVDVLYHTGKVSCFSSISVLIPEYNLGLSILCNMGDFLVGTNLMDNIYEDIISLLLEKDKTNERIPIPKSAYIVPHIITNTILILCVLLCVFTIILLFRKGQYFQNNLLNISFTFLVHLLIPIGCFKVFSVIGIPLEAVSDFAPDIMMTIIFCSSILLGSGIFRVLLCFE